MRKILSYNNVASVTWLGDWREGQPYLIGDVIHVRGHIYIVTRNHYSTRNREPGEGRNWSGYLSQLVSNTENHIVDHYAHKFAKQIDQEILESIYRKAGDEHHLTEDDFKI